MKVESIDVLESAPKLFRDLMGVRRRRKAEKALMSQFELI